MSFGKTGFGFLAVLAVMFGLLAFGCAQTPANPSGHSSPWAADSNQSSGQPATPSMPSNSSSIEIENKPVPYNFSALEPANSTLNATGNEIMAPGEGNSTALGFFDLLAANSTANVTLSQFSRHSTASSCWTVIHGDAFDVTGLVGTYPSGASKILNLCALDGTMFYDSEFSREMENATAVLEPLFMGIYVG